MQLHSECWHQRLHTLRQLPLLYHSLERPEKQKLLFVISDGAPNANQYGGIGAKRDLQKIRKKLLQQGVFFQAAAIGSDKEAIQEIYEESFLDITDLEQLPALLTKKLLRFIRR